MRRSVTRQVLPFLLRNWVLYERLVFLDPARGHRLRPIMGCPTAKQIQDSFAVAHRCSLESVLRHAEVALAPLCALASAARFSGLAAELWGQWRKTLYHRWLLRAFTLRAQGELKPEWLQQGAAAFYNNQRSCVSLWWEAIKHGAGAWASARVRRNEKHPGRSGSRSPASPRSMTRCSDRGQPHNRKPDA